VDKAEMNKIGADMISRDRKGIFKIWKAMKSELNLFYMMLKINRNIFGKMKIFRNLRFIKEFS